jgi:ABC-2 type transport system permease protein
VLPYAFINFYPAQFILGKEDYLGFPPVLVYLTPAVGIILFVVAYQFWRVGLNHYKSTGS